MKYLLTALLILLITLTLWFFTWNKLQELAFSGNGAFKSQSDDLGPLLTNYSIDFPIVRLSNANSYHYRFKRFPSNNTTWLFIDIEGLTRSDITTLPEISLIVREDGIVVFQRDGKLNFNSRNDHLDKIWGGLKPLGQSSIETNWFGQYEIDLIIHAAPKLEKDLGIELRLVSGWK